MSSSDKFAIVYFTDELRKRPMSARKVAVAHTPGGVKPYVHATGMIMAREWADLYIYRNFDKEDRAEAVNQIEIVLGADEYTIHVYWNRNKYSAKGVKSLKPLARFRFQPMQSLNTLRDYMQEDIEKLY